MNVCRVCFVRQWLNPPYKISRSTTDACVCPCVGVHVCVHVCVYVLDLCICVCVGSVHMCMCVLYPSTYMYTDAQVVLAPAFPSPPTHIPDVVHIWVVFWWREEQLDPGSQLHAADGGVGKVEEDTKHHSNRDELQNRSSKGR